MYWRLPTLSILDKEDAEALYRRATTLLHSKGFRVDCPQMCRLLRKAGARVDDTRHMVYLPPELLARAVAACPREFDMCDLDGNIVRFAAGTITETVSTYIEAVQWLDYGADRLRPSTLVDLRLALKVADSLAAVRSTGIIVWPMDLPPERQFAAALLVVLTATRKLLTFGVQNRDQAQMLLAGLAVAAPSLDIRKRPPCMFVTSPISPLVLDGDSAEAMIVCLEAGLVPVLAPCPMAGATSPYSIAGTVLQQVAESLFMLAAKFAVAPEAPVLWGGAAAAMDMSSADVSYGGIERSLMMLANIDMAEFLGLPCHSPAGSVDSCLSDAQLGAEKTWTFLTRCLSGAATGLGVGAITNGKAVSAEQMLIDVDLISCLKRLAAGINTHHLLAAAEELRQTDHGGNFMMAEQTLRLLRDGQEYCQPLTFNRDGTDGPPALQRAHEQLERIAAEWKSPVPEEVRAELESLLA